MKTSTATTRPTFQNLPSHGSQKAVLAVAIAALLAIPSAQAVSYTWSGSVAGGDWNTGSNWGGTVPNDATGLAVIGTLNAGSAVNISSSVTTGTLTLNGANSMSLTASTGQTLTLGGAGNGVVINVSGVGTKTIDANLVLGYAGSFGNLNISSGASLVINGAVTGSKELSLANAGKLTLTNANNSFGTLTVANGEVAISSIADIGVNSAAGSGYSGGSTVLKIGSNGNASTATLTYTGVAVSTNRQISIGSSAGSIINSSGSGELTFTATTFNGQQTINKTSSVSTILTLSGANNGTISGKIQDNLGTSPVVNVSKSGAGTWTLGGANTYTGTTTVTQGRLNVNGSLIAASAVSVDNATLGGSGTVNGSVTVTNGTIDGTGLQLKGATSFSGVSTLAGLSTATSGYSVTSGTLNVTGTTTSAVTVSGGVLQGAGKVGDVAVSGTLAGTLSTGVISGLGTVSPGNSPGILTATSVDVSGGIDFNLEFTLANTSPIYSNANASGNDILRLTSATPFSGILNDNNVINIYLTSDAVGTTYLGGFFTSLSAENLLETIQGAKITYYVLDADGTFTYNQNQYSLLESSNIVLSATSVTSANFSGGNADGSELLISVVPEPATWAMLVGGFGMLMGCQKLRRRITK